MSLELHLDKMQSRARQYIFTGFADEAGAIRYYNAATRKIKVSWNLYFQRSDPALADDDDGPMSLPLGGEVSGGEARALMGMEVWARARWEKMKMGTRTDPSAKDTAHRIPAARSEPIALTLIIDCSITPWPELPEHDTWQPSFPIKTLAPSLTIKVAEG